MIDNELENFYFLYNNLMEEDNNNKNNKTITTNSHKREDIITQILADKGGFRINNDPSLFYEDRNIVHLKIRVTKNSETDNIVKECAFIRTKKNFQETIELDGPAPKIKFIININKENYINISNENENPVTYYNRKMGESESSSKKSTGKRSTNSKRSDQSKKSEIKLNNCFDYCFRDQRPNDENYYIHVRQRSHEIDGSLIANNAINDLKNIVGDIIYYPKDPSIQIAKGQKVFIEVKQNTTINKIFSQMKKLIEDINDICEGNYMFLGFVNKENLLKCFSNDNNNLDKEKEESFKAEIKTIVEKYKKFNICFLIIENNEFLGNSLEDRADYSFYYYNLTSQKIDALENKIDTKIKGIQSEVKEIKREVKEIKNEIDGLNNKVNDIDSKMKDISELRIVRTWRFDPAESEFEVR